RCSDARSLDRALDELVPALYARHETADAWYAAARARLALARLGVIARPRAHPVIGRSCAAGAVAALRRAVKLDSLHAPAIALLADPDLRRLARTSGYPERDAIRAAASRRPPDVELLQARAQMETDLGNAALAVEAADQLLAVAADSGLAWLAVARARLLAGELASGYAAWLA